MPKAILELPKMPENCSKCPCLTLKMNFTPKCGVLGEEVLLFKFGRQPDCPLKLVEGKGVEP